MTDEPFLKSGRFQPHSRYNDSSRTTPDLSKDSGDVLSIIEGKSAFSRLVDDGFTLRGYSRVDLPRYSELPVDSKASSDSSRRVDSIDPQDVWKEIMAGIENSQDFDYSDDFVDEDDSDDSKSQADKSPTFSASPSCANSGTATHIPSTVPNGLAAKYNINRDLTPLSNLKPLSHREMIQEMRLKLQRSPQLDHITLLGVTSYCSQSICEKFDRFTEEIWKTSNAVRSNILREICDLSCTTIVQFGAAVEQILYMHNEVVSGNSMRVDASALNLWLSGRTYEFNGRNAASPINLRTIRRELSKFPASLSHHNLLPAALFAAISRHAFGIEIPDSNLGKMTSRQYSLAIDRIFLRNSGILVNSGFRELACSTWKKLSSVFLAQDPRMLIFIDSWLEHSKNATRHAHITAGESVRILEGIWPDSGIQFDAELVPQVQIDLPASVQSVYGANMERLFKRAELERCWRTIIAACEDKNAIVEVDMSLIASETMSKISRMRIPDPRSPILGTWQEEPL